MSQVTIYKIGNVYMSQDLWGLELNGQQVGSNRNWAETWLTFEQEPKTIEKVVTREFTDRYRKGDEIMGTEQFADLLDSCKDEEGEYKSLDDEYNARKLIADWLPEKETEKTATPYDIVIIPLTANERDVPPYCYPMRLFAPNLTKDNLGLYTYAPNRLQMLKDRASRKGLAYTGDKPTRGLNWCIPRHSEKELKLIQLNMAYTQYDKLAKIRSCVGTLDECWNAHDDNVLLIDSFWDDELMKLNATIPNAPTAGAIHNKLLSIKTQVSSILSAKKSEQYREQTKAVEQLNDLINLLRLIPFTEPDEQP